ncbi:hypothetical protein VOLCADRAFT_86483 [Volvox carteri f. nagariensis]|uniref:Uncharacterized protein n=1 Tax=Volvox carteri f. nagariensis TaxID=3068 RepID=D8TGU2_VOLCA|nr:uncharacterized protein VOLCADRAFT_86483 [Volvox carteri f. nagariensis]EFJ52959.1 hypothetical protein VOLCADRAFT_86483 [Volvox carteri f. nagariensis]|eukprot:XP_002945964.1 hypothetical protein VOLCADRAFT_86483 [Volvox carteri f. nagariensis]
MSDRALCSLLKPYLVITFSFKFKFTLNKEQSQQHILCNEDKFRGKTKPGKLVDGVNEQALKRAASCSGFRKQVFHGFATQGKLALVLLDDAPQDVKGAIKVLRRMVHRTEVGMAVTNALAAEPCFGLSAADICFSILCNEDKFRDKKKPRKLVEGVKEQALMRAASRSGGARAATAQAETVQAALEETDSVGPSRVHLTSAAISTYFRMAGKATPTDYTACGIVWTLAEKRLHGKPLQHDALEPEDIAVLARLVGPSKSRERLLVQGGYPRRPSTADEYVGPLLRPVQWMQCGGYLSGPLTGTREAPVHSLSYTAFRTRLLRMVSLAGITRHIKAHSMCIGGNSTAVDRGVPAELHKAYGRWRTDAMVQHYMVQHYTRRDTAAKLEVSRRLGLTGLGQRRASGRCPLRGGWKVGESTEGGLGRIPRHGLGLSSLVVQPWGAPGCVGGPHSSRVAAGAGATSTQLVICGAERSLVTPLLNICGRALGPSAGDSTAANRPRFLTKSDSASGRWTSSACCFRAMTRTCIAGACSCPTAYAFFTKCSSPIRAHPAPFVALDLRGRRGRNNKHNGRELPKVEHGASGLWYGKRGVTGKFP